MSPMRSGRNTHGRGRARLAERACTPGAAGADGGGRAGGPGCGARGRWRGLAGLRGDAPSEARGADGSRAGHRPRAHQAARPNNTPLGARNPRGHKHQPDPQDKQRSYETSDTSTGGDHQEFETPNTTARRRGHENGRIHWRTCHRFQPRQWIGEQRSPRHHLASVGLAIPNQVRTSSPSRAARPHQAEQDEFSRAVASPAPRGAWRASVTPQRAENWKKNRPRVGIQHPSHAAPSQREKEKPPLRGGPAPQLKHYSPLRVDPAPRMKHYSPLPGGPAPQLKYFSPTHTQNG